MAAHFSDDETRDLGQETQSFGPETQELGQETQAMDSPDLDVIQSVDDEQDALAALKALEDRRNAKRRSSLIKAGAVAAALALSVGGFLFVRSIASRPKAESPYEMADVVYDDFRVSVQGSGALQPYAQVVVTPEVDGIISSVNVREGQQVKAGDVLFTLRNSEIDKAIADAEEAYAKAQQDVDKAYEALAKAECDRDTARAEHYSAQAAADAARANAQAAYDAAFNPIKNDADAKFNSEQARYDAAKASLDPDGKKKAYDKAAEACTQAQDALKRAEDDYNFAESNAKAHPESAEAQRELAEATKKRDEAIETLGKARATLSDTESKYTDAVNKMKPYEESLSRANIAHQEALAAAASAGDAAKSRYTIPDVPSYDEASYKSAIESAKNSITSAESALNSAKRTLDTERERGEKRTVKAPTTGNLISFSAVKGASVGGASGGTATASRSSSLATIADTSQMRVSLEINEIDIVSIKAGQRASVTFASIPGLEQEARVIDVATIATGSGESSGSGGNGVATFTVDCVIPKPDPRLKPGMTATITIYTTDLDHVLVVPVGALRELSDGTFVDVVSNSEEVLAAADGSVAPQTTRVEVKVSETSSSQAVIVSGVSEGDVVLVSGSSSKKNIEEMTQEEIDQLTPEEIEELGTTVEED